MIGTLVGTVWLYIVIPKGFFPIEDTGFINVIDRRSVGHFLQAP